MTDAPAFEAFVRTHQDMVYATAIRLLGNRTEAEDVAQTVFLRAFQRFDQIGSSPAAAGWLKTVTRHVCLNHLSRYRARWKFFSEIDQPGDRADAQPFEPAAVEQSPSAGFDEAERQARLEDALRQLPDHQRVPLVLFHFEQQSYQEIADTLRVSLGKVKTDIHRAREALRKLLSTTDAPR
jgi:RNA polymerase sigma-70 factor (ECF subfamily)